MISRAAYRRRWRPSRLGLAAIIGAAVLLDVVVSSVASFALGPLPLRATLFGLPAIGLAGAATYFMVRALHDHRPHSRARDGSRAAILLVAALFLWLVVLDVYTFTSEAGPGVAALCALACVPTTAFGLWIVRRLDRNEKEPWRLVLVAALWGAIVSTSLVLWGEALWDAVFTANLVPGPAADTSSAYSAGIFEELAKGTAVLLLYLLMRDEFDDVVDGIVYGAAVGLGFNFMESVGYMTHLYATLAPEGAGGLAAAGQWYFRQVLGLFFGHATYTALIGAGIGLARQLPRLRERIIVIAGGFLAAIAAHFAWDAYQAFVLIGGASTVVQFVLVHARYLVIVGPFNAVILVLLAMGLHIEGMALNRQLRAEVASGTGAVLPAEVAVLMRPWRRFRARLSALGRAGLGGYTRQARLQTAQLSLAMERWHRERDEIDQPLAAEDALRRRVLELRATV